MRKPIKSFKVSIFCLLTVLFLFPAQAEEFDGNRLHEFCQFTIGEPQEAFCTGYILGSWSGINWGGEKVWFSGKSAAPSVNIFTALERSFGVCMPPGVQNGQIIDITVKYLDEHPELRHLSATALVNLAFSEAFPCR